MERWKSVAVALAIGCGAGVGRGAQALEYEIGDVRAELHGNYELQLRGIARDLDLSDNLDLTQWYDVLNLEAEFDFAPNGIGPFDVLQGFLRVEVRYDCVWTHGCGIFSSANAFGDHAKKLPKRYSDGRRAGFFGSGTLFTGDTRVYRDIPRDKLPFAFKDLPSGAQTPSPFFDIGGIDVLFSSPGANGVFGDADDPAPFYFSRALEDCDFTFRHEHGAEGGVGVQNMVWNPGCTIRPIAALADKPNPLRAGDVSPITGLGGAGALPLRPAPERRFGSVAPGEQAEGVYFPNARLQKLLRNDELDDFDQNFSQADLAWNHGASQQDERELKEAYLDIEMFDSRLWLRIGKQTVVWGKTELFRNQDRLNPQDLALASLPSLEESRIGLWMARLVYQFYNIGPLEDVRAELVLTFDDFEPNDLGRCGEPYAPNPVCNKTFGLYIHGFTGFALAGEERPPAPWENVRGLEGGVRIEWRWDRYSFSITDFYGYADLPVTTPVFTYSRNVDPASGRPRRAESAGRCRKGGESDCLTPEVALEQQSVNQQLFHMICATSIGFTSLDLSACGQTVFNSTKPTENPFAVASPRVLVALNSVLTGDPGRLIVSGLAASLSGLVEDPAVSQARMTAQLAPFGIDSVSVPLNVDPRDGGPDLPLGNPLRKEPDFFSSVEFFYVNLRGSLSARLSDEQEALLGCGRFYRTSCDLDGIDLMNAEASVLFQSWPGFEGTLGDWDTTDASVAQPGTVGFHGGPVCTRFENGKQFLLPGCRGPRDPGYDKFRDGTVKGLVQPFTGQQFQSEMAALSWNALMGFVAFSAAPKINVTTFDINDVLRGDGCSFRKPQLCSNVQALFQVSGVQRNDIRAGGNGGFGRRDFVWSGGRDLVLQYQKLNVLGFSMDFAEDVTKSNWGVEFTWEDQPLLGDNDAFLGHTPANRYNLTVSVDRPTFVNFLNANRTFFVNTQWFFQYIEGYRDSFTDNGPLNVLAVLAINTGYFEDRLQPALTLVYDFNSNSGAAIPQVTYRYSSNFSATVGLALFCGREQPRDMALYPTVLSNRVGRHANDDFVENGLSAVRDRDEMFLRVRYTF